MPVDKAPTLPWLKGPENYQEFGNKVITYFKDQLSRVEDMHVASLPLAGIALLWKLKDRKNLDVHFFDYGYKDVDENVGPFIVHNVQITAPVNFGVLQHAAELLGFHTTLEKNQAYIQRMLHEDTVMMGYLHKVLDHIPSLSVDPNKFAYGTFHERVQELNPEETITEANILNYRMRRVQMDTFIAVAKDSGRLKKDYKFTEGSYHLAVSK